MPTAEVPDRAAASVALPLPEATSSTRQPARKFALSASISLARTMRDATTAKSPLAHVCCCRVLTFERSGTVAVVVVISFLPHDPSGRVERQRATAPPWRRVAMSYRSRAYDDAGRRTVQAMNRTNRPVVRRSCSTESGLPGLPVTGEDDPVERYTD